MNGYDQSGAAFLSSAKEFFRNLISWLGEEESEAEHPGVVTGTGAAATSEHVDPLRTEPAENNTVDAGPGNNAAPPQVPQQPQVKTYLHRESTPQVATDPPVSEAQRRAMFAAKEGHSNLGIPKSVGSEFAESDPGGHLPDRKSKDEEPGNGETGGPPGPWYDPGTQEETGGPGGGIAKPGESNINDRFETSPDGTQVRNNETGEIFVRVDDVQDEAPSGWGSPRFDEVEAEDDWSPEAREAAARARSSGSHQRMQSRTLSRAVPGATAGVAGRAGRYRILEGAGTRGGMWGAQGRGETKWFKNRQQAEEHGHLSSNDSGWSSPQFSRDAWSPEARAAAAASRKQRGGVARTPSTPATTHGTFQARQASGNIPVGGRAKPNKWANATVIKGTPGSFSPWHSPSFRR